MPAPRILALAGSTRRDSFNKRLVRLAAEHAQSAGAEITIVDLADYPLPLFDQDLEADQGLPEPAKELKRHFIDHAGLLIASPEYNSSITAVLKNAIDWISRPHEKDEPSLIAFRGKTAALLSASPGALGGLRGLVHVRAILSSIGVLVLPDQIAVSRAHEAFDDSGQLRDEKLASRVNSIASNLVTTVKQLTA